MGIYINPKPTTGQNYPVSDPGTKEAWLLQNAAPITQREASRFDSDNDRERALVCLIDNGQFTAAGVAYNNRERDIFLHPDPRRRLWFLVPVDKLTEDVGMSPGFPTLFRDKSQWEII
jgi:hypothetical protein